MTAGQKSRRHFVCKGTLEYETRNAELEQEVAELRTISTGAVEGLRLYFERYKISVSDFKTAQDKTHKSKERLDTAMREFEEYEQQRQQFVKMCKARDRGLPLIEIMVDYIERIIISDGRHIVVKVKLNNWV